MPLDRLHLTYAAAIMLPTYVVLSAVFGLAYIFDPGDRLAQIPAGTFQRAVLPLWAWGSVMLALAALMIGAAATGARLVFAYALSCASATWFMWGCTIGAAIVLTPNTSFLAPVLPWFVAVACAASAKSLLRREQRP